MDWLQLLKEYGLPLAFAAAFTWAILTRKFVTGSELKERATEGEARLGYVEARRTEEREARLLSETRLDQSLEVTKDQTALLKEIERELARIGPARRG